MTANHSIDPAQFLSDHLERAEPDLLRAMLKTFIDALMGAEADALCGAPYGARSDDRVNFRNGYRAREWDTRAGTMEVAIPKLRAGSYFPDWLLERRRRAERALTTVVTSPGRSTRRSPVSSRGGSAATRSSAWSNRSARSICSGQTSEASHRRSSSRLACNGIRSSPARQTTSGSRVGSGTGPLTAQDKTISLSPSRCSPRLVA